MIALSLTKGETILPETFSSTTVYFSDINGFPELIAAASTPLQTIFVMNTLYDTCDNVIEKYDVFKVETVKDAYLVSTKDTLARFRCFLHIAYQPSIVVLQLVSGLPNRNGINHASEISNLALILRREISVLQFNFAENLQLKLRVGIHSGPCVAAVIGLKMPVSGPSNICERNHAVMDGGDNNIIIYIRPSYFYSDIACKLRLLSW